MTASAASRSVVPLVLLLAIAWVNFAEASAPAVPHSQTAASPRAALNLPLDENGPMPRLLSQTGAFHDVAQLKPAPALQPYELNVPFWSDGAAKSRWMVLPASTSPQSWIVYSPAGEWHFPIGTVFVKHFELPVDEGNPAKLRRLETRVIVVNSTGGVYGVTYRWRSDQSDADLLSTNLVEPISIQTASGVRTQNWYYPSRVDCHTCHTPLNGGVLGLNTRQLNRAVLLPDGSTANQLQHWKRLGLLANAPEEPATASRLPPPDDSAATLQQRARAWLDANCSHCHRPGGTVASFDARFDTPLAEQNLLNGPVLIDEGIDHARVVAPHDLWRSILYLRASTLEPLKMPPLAHQMVDPQGLALLKAWIESLPGPPVLAPPVITPSSRSFRGRIRVTLQHPDPKAELRYSLDGSVPGKSAPVYRQPLDLTEPTTVRAKAFRLGYTRSITVQETFVIDE